MQEKWYEDNDKEDATFSTLDEYDITSTPNDFNISTIFSLIDNAVIQIPPFQRNYVWDEKRASKLIESIILGLPVPQVFLYEAGKNNFYVIDGQQRLLSIYFFMKQRFPTKKGKIALREVMSGGKKIDQTLFANEELFKNFSLNLPTLTNEENGNDAKNKLDKKKYDTLGEYKYTFEILRTIRTVVIKQNEPNDDSSIYEIFNRLNTGGQNLSAQEIRMSLYYSKFYEMLLEINKDSRWRKLLNQDTPDNRLKDIEILMRSFSLLISGQNYTAPLGKFLNTISKETCKFADEKILYCKKLFDSFLESCSKLPTGAFCTANGKFIISLFEAVFVATCEKAYREEDFLCKNICSNSLLDLKNNTNFKSLSQDGVASVAKVLGRIKEARVNLTFENR